MSKRRTFSLVRAGSVIAVAALLAACTKGGQFDPTSILDNDMFNTKKPLQGQREPVFPNGVPGATNGVPADLYKGYQPPPEQAADNGEGATAAVPDNAPPKPEPKAKPQPKPKVAHAPTKPRATVNVGLANKPKPTPQQQAQAPQPAQTAWPNPNQGAQPAQTAWPNPNQSAQPAQTAWPNPNQPAQTAWPNPTGPAPSGQ